MNQETTEYIDKVWNLYEMGKINALELSEMLIKISAKESK